MKPEYSSLQMRLNEVSLAVPELPTVIRYYDDFSDRLCEIQEPAKQDIWKIVVLGSSENLDFRAFADELRPFIKHWCCNIIQLLCANTARIRLAGLRNIALSDLLEVLTSTPAAVRPIWNAVTAKNYSNMDMSALKSTLYHVCRLGLSGWSAHYGGFLSSLPLPRCDKYAAVRRGDVFLSVDEEAALVAYIDNACGIIRNSPSQIYDEELRDVAVLVCAYQFGMRPMQIGMLRLKDVRIWTEIDDPLPSVHLTFKMVKQRRSTKALPLPRRVKQEWAPLFVELHARSARTGLTAEDHLFRVSSAREISSIVLRITAEILPEARSATELRHTAAQRLVDAGANQEELAEFLGHSDIETGLVYFQSSANQAERVNNALGISPIYQTITKVAHDRFIDKEELAELKGEQQIGAVPHGIPIAGIGACAVGQSSCPSNPVTACYGCYKFMPVNDPTIHQQVLADFRSVVSLFVEASRGDDHSPAYVQLKRTISNVQSIIAELEGEADE